MKRVVSVSLGSRSRDYRITVTLLGQEISIERVGTDGDVARAAALYRELDGQVDCLGIGGAALYVDTLKRRYVMSAVQRMISGVRHTPVVDGVGFRDLLEGQAARYLLEHAPAPIEPRRALSLVALDRMALTRGLADAGFELIIGDLAFALGVPVALHSLAAINRVGTVLLPVMRHLPMSLIYPTGEREDANTPRYGRWFAWAAVIAGDCNYISRFMPADMRGKVVMTNTTTLRNVEQFRERGVRYLLTSTPRLGERSFGTNLMEAALVALSGKGRVLDAREMAEMVEAVGWRPNLEVLNP
jgi:hypothetical protein